MAERHDESELERLKRIRAEVAAGKRSVSPTGPARPSHEERNKELKRIDHAIAQIEAGGGVQDA